jgi:hypothetical protein
MASEATGKKTTLVVSGLSLAGSTVYPAARNSGSIGSELPNRMARRKY